MSDATVSKSAADEALPVIAAAKSSSARARGLRLGVIFAALPLGMLGLSYAAVPLYNLFCQVTGFGGTTQVARAAPSEVLERTMTVRFDANIAAGLPLKFAPEKQAIVVRLGETALAFYDVTNTSDASVSAVATYNVAPHATGPFFQKLECFCFLEQTFEPGQTQRLPVIFFVDPELDGSRNADSIQTVTLSYTFFEAKAAQERLGPLPKAPSQPVTALAPELPAPIGAS
jgi:cytochrome c oxidase assembly protein subunit 11